MKYLTLTLVLIGLLLATGCNPLRHYQKVAVDSDVTKKEKDIIRPWVVTHFPTSIKVTPGSPDTAVLHNRKEMESLYGSIGKLKESLDSAILEQLGTQEAADTYKLWFLSLRDELDSLEEELAKKCITREIRIRDTSFLEDGPIIDGLKSAVVDLKQSNLTLEASNNSLLKENTDLNRTVNRSSLKWWLIIVGLCLVIAGLVFLLFKR